MSGPASKAPARRLRISIRLKMLLVTSAVLLTAIGTYVYLAVDLMTRDKIAYIYDLNATLAATLSEQTRGSFDLLVRELGLYVRGADAPGIRVETRRDLDADFFRREPDVLRVETFVDVQNDGSYLGRGAAVNAAALAEMELQETDLDVARRERPLPLNAIVTRPSYVHVQNSSLPPDAAILTLAFSPGPGRVVAADFRHERLLRIFGRSALHESYLIDEAGEILAHPDAAAVIAGRDRAHNPLVQQALASDVQQAVTEFVDESTGIAYLGAWAKVGFGRTWVLTQIPKAYALRAADELVQRSVLFAVAILLAAFLVSILFSRLLAAPIARLRAATETIGKGRFDIHVDVGSRDEIGELAAAFNRMARELKSTQAQLVQSEKLAAFGQLGAGITHEVKNPMTGIVGFAQLAQRKADDPAKMLELVKLIEKEGLRCRDILVNFLKFARASEGQREPLELNRVVEDAAAMLRHQLTMHRVRLDLDLASAQPRIEGNAAELQQVLLNLAINAQQAMPEGGRLRFATSVNGPHAIIRVADDGPGIPEEIRGRIFEPFFTTKPAGQGTGLGLSVSFGIVRAHNGTLEVESEVGRGATFIIRLPALAGSSVAASA